MSPAPTPVQPFMPIMPPHFMRNQFNNTPMQQPIPMPVPYPFFQFNKYNNYGHYNNFNNNYYQNKRRKGQKFNNYNKNYNNNKNYYRNNQYNKEKNEIEKDMKDLEIDIENKIDIEEYENLETDEDKKNYLGEKVYTAIEESQLAVDKKLSSEDIAKITGMIIAIPDNEIVETVQNSTLFNNRIKEALRLLNK